MQVSQLGLTELQGLLESTQPSRGPGTTVLCLQRPMLCPPVETRAESHTWSDSRAGPQLDSAVEWMCITLDAKGTGTRLPGGTPEAPPGFPRPCPCSGPSPPSSPPEPALLLGLGVRVLADPLSPEPLGRLGSSSQIASWLPHSLAHSQLAF